MNRYQQVLLGAVLLPTLAAGQQPLALSKPDAACAEPFTQIASTRELRDGRVLVLDRRDRLVLLVDLRKGTAQRVGREGTGPGEYTQPGRLFVLPADTTQRRGGIPKWSDARGRLFTEGSPYAAGELRAADSTAITRLDRAASKGDTLAWVHLDKETIQVRSLPGGGASVSNGVRAFASRDDWVALPDGGVAVVRVLDYRVDWFSAAGERASGPIVKVDRIPVSDADMAQARKELMAMMRAAMPRNGGGAGAARPTDQPAA